MLEWLTDEAAKTARSLKPANANAAELPADLRRANGRSVFGQPVPDRYVADTQLVAERLADGVSGERRPLLGDLAEQRGPIQVAHHRVQSLSGAQ